MVKFYTAGKVWHNVKFSLLREMGYPVHARWIDLDNKGELVTTRKNNLWQMCFEDVRDSDFLLLYTEEFSEELRGALVEIGMAYGMNKPVYAINTCKSLKANDISDVAFTHHHLWTRVPESSLSRGAAWATAHYMKNHMKLAA